MKDARILVTGGTGFLGRHVVRALERRGCRHVFAPTHQECDLTREADIHGILQETDAEIVIHLAAVVGGIGANLREPGRFFYENLHMGTMLMEHARRAQVRKFVGIGTICSYPKFTPVPFSEDGLWDGYPEETNAPYGMAKKMLLVQGQAYRQQYGFNAIHLLPVNLYGPGDNFDAVSSHVIPALVRKCLEAKDSGAREIVCWGDGTATREFLYVEDCAEAIALATEKYDGPLPVNVGAGFEISIRDLTTLVAELCGFAGRMAWDRSKPNGQPRRSLDTSRAEALFGFRAGTTLRDGLSRTIAWYHKARESSYNLPHSSH
jgi:GDP-L-fucose synthase